MRLSRFAFIAGALVLMTAGLSAQDKPEVAAQKTAESWLALIDAGKYADSYDAASDEFKAQLTKEKWVEMAKGARGGTGAFESRKLVNALYTENIPNAPPGKYVALTFQAKYAGGTATEQIVSINEKDQSWRPIGYVISPLQ